jgi:hypothetical protein
MATNTIDPTDLDLKIRLPRKMAATLSEMAADQLLTRAALIRRLLLDAVLVRARQMRNEDAEDRTARALKGRSRQ